MNTLGLEQFSNGKGKIGMMWLLLFVLLSDQSSSWQTHQKSEL